MPNFNKVILIGHLTRDPDLRYLASGTAVCEMGLAVNHKYTSNGEKKEEVCFVDIVIWGKQGENCKEYLEKGRAILVEGRLHFSSWKSQSGENRSKLKVVADKVVFMPGGNREQRPVKKEEEKQPYDYSNTVDDGEIPF